jgi:hypothetical protein
MQYDAERAACEVWIPVRWFERPAWTEKEGPLLTDGSVLLVGPGVAFLYVPTPEVAAAAIYAFAGCCARTMTDEHAI